MVPFITYSSICMQNFINVHIILKEISLLKKYMENMQFSKLSDCKGPATLNDSTQLDNRRLCVYDWLRPISLSRKSFHAILYD